MPVTDYPSQQTYVDIGSLAMEINDDADVVVDVDHILTDEGFLHIFMADVLTSEQETALWAVVGSHIDAQVVEPKGAKILTGTYTGDGTTSQAIVAWTEDLDAHFIMITPRKTSDALLTTYWTTSAIIDDNANGGAIKDTSKFEDNRIISINSDGFTVDDNSGNGDPNKSGRVYNYVVIGELL